MLEAVRLFAANRRPWLADEEVALDEIVQLAAGDRRVAEIVDGARPEDAPGDGSPPQHRALAERQPVDPGRDHCLHRGRNTLGSAARLEQHPHRLLDEQRVALGRAEHRLALGIGQLGRFAVHERRKELRAVLERQRLELDRGRAHVAATPRRPLVEEILAGKAEDEQRHVLDATREVLDQVEHRLLGQVDVLEDEHERLEVCELGRPRLRRPGDLGRRSFGAADRVQHPGRERQQIGHSLVTTAVSELLVGGLDRVVVRDAGGHLHHLGNGPVRDALPVGKAAAGEDRRALDAVDELSRQSRLTDARGSEHRHEVDAVVPDDAREGVVEQLDLLLAPDERHGDDEPATDVLGDRDDTPGFDPTREASCLLGSERRRHDDPAGELLDRRSEHDLARLRRLLEARRRVDRETGGERRLGLIREDLARLDSDPDLEAELADALDDPERGADGALRVVLVGERNPECRHHGVPGELLHDAAVRRDAVRDLVEEAVQARADDLRVGARDELRRADEIDEKDRGKLALHP